MKLERAASCAVRRGAITALLNDYKRIVHAVDESDDRMADTRQEARVFRERMRRRAHKFQSNIMFLQSLCALISSPVPSSKSLSLSFAVLERFYCLYVTLRCDLER